MTSATATATGSVRSSWKSSAGAIPGSLTGTRSSHEPEDEFPPADVLPLQVHTLRTGRPSRPGDWPMTSASQPGCSEFTRLGSLRRRDVIRAGTLGLFGWPMLAGRRLAQGAEGSEESGFGRARRCIFLFMWGGPSQLDTFDMKPDRPAEIRGEFQPIATNVPGVQILRTLPASRVGDGSRGRHPLADA